MRTSSCDTRVRLLIVYEYLNQPHTLEEITNHIRNSTGLTAERRSIYNDIYAIESLMPIERKIIEKKTYYSLKGET